MKYFLFYCQIFFENSLTAYVDMTPADIVSHVPSHCLMPFNVEEQARVFLIFVSGPDLYDVTELANTDHLSNQQVW